MPRTRCRGSCWAVFGPFLSTIWARVLSDFPLLRHPASQGVKAAPNGPMSGNVTEKSARAGVAPSRARSFYHVTRRADSATLQLLSPLLHFHIAQRFCIQP